MPQSSRATDTSRVRDPRTPSQPRDNHGERSPLLDLQQRAGNAAVTALVGPTVQRHVSPATAAMGMSNHASIILHGAQLMTANQQLQMTAQQLTAIEQGVNQDAINTIIHNVQAESYPAAQPTPQPASGDAPSGTVTLGEPVIHSGGERIY